VYLAQGYKICFDSQGVWIAIESNNNQPIDFKLFNPLIERYILQKYPGATIVEALFTNGNYELKLINNEVPLELKFDITGNLIQ